jgi:hypothetical protein
LFHKDDFVRKAFQIVEWPRVKEYVEAMLMTTAPKHFIAQWVSRNLDFECDREVIQKYAKYFWDLNLLDTSELRALLQMRFESLDKHPDPEIKEQARAFKSVGYRDARRLAADMPFSPISSILVQLRMGILPNHIDVSRILKKTREVTSIKLFEAVTSNNKGDSSKAFDLSVVMEKMNVVLESMGQPAEELKEQLAAIALHTDTSTIPTIHQLSQGQHTVEVAPIGTTDELTDVYQGDEDDSELDDS